MPRGTKGNIVLIITWGLVLASGRMQSFKSIGANTWIFLALSGITTGLSWLFYFKALQIGEASKVVPLDKLSVVFTILLSFLILKEPLSPKVIAGGLLIMLGALILTRNESVLSHYVELEPKKTLTYKKSNLLGVAFL